VILAATERLLSRLPLHEITVASILDESGIGRKTFYSYFGSKFEAVAALLERVIEDFYDVFRPFVDGAMAQPQEDAIRAILTKSTELWVSHRAVGRATHEHWRAVPEIRGPWLAFVQRFSEAVATEIDRQRARGLAPPGRDSRQLASALLWTTEHLLYVAGSDSDPNFSDEASVLETLITIWTATLYRTQGTTL
jgi:AcrR family transcriptional regulator